MIEMNPGRKSTFSFNTSLPTLQNRNQAAQIKGNFPQAGTGNNGIPAHVTNVRAVGSNATVGSTCTVSVLFHRNPADTAFSNVKVYAKGYQGSQSPTLLTSGTDSPLQ